MKHTSPARALRHASPLIASLISYILLVTPLVPLAYGANKSRRQVKSEVVKTDAGRAAEAPAEATDAQTANAAASAAAALVAFAPGITATKTDSFPDPNGDGKAAPGETITYTVTITNSGPDPATGVTFNDTPDSNTTLVAGSITTQPIAQNDTASAFGNVNISTANGAPNLLANDCDPSPSGGACTNAGLTASGPTTSANNGNVTVNADGTFTYNPFPGFTGTDSFTYTVTDGTGKTDTATMTITVGPTLIWFIDNSAASNGDGRFGSPFNSIANFNAGAADDAGDIIFLYTGTGTYTGGFTLLNSQKLIGQGFALTTETGTPPAGSPTLPTAGAAPTIDNPGSNIITLGSGNTLRGFNTGNSGAAGTDISGTGFGTLTVSALSINGDGRALNLTTGTLAATIANISASNTGSNAGLVLNAAGGTMVVSGSTTITNPGGTGIDLTNLPVGTAHNFGQTTVNKNSTSGVGVNIASNNAAAQTTFTTLTVTTQNGFALLT
ncbi:MAG TPA: Ig-like domain-containing protein, partial [Pyrinomonadaceae bacterium]|nr:Ig-like domain-containing protein [Pyrinomonadaceae bacterium]